MPFSQDFEKNFVVDEKTKFERCVYFDLILFKMQFDKLDLAIG